MKNNDENAAAMGSLVAPDVEALGKWMQEVTALLCFQPEVPTQHKTDLCNALNEYNMVVEAQRLAQPNDKAEPRRDSDSLCKPEASPPLAPATLFGKYSEETIDKLLNEPNQKPSPELGYGSLQPIDGWEPGQEIQHDGHSRYLSVTQRREERKPEQNHLKLPPTQ